VLSIGARSAWGAAAVSPPEEGRISRRKYWYPVLFRTFSMTHQAKLVVNPPSRTTQSFGSPVQSVVVPCWADRTAIGDAASSPKANDALMIPEKVATRIPLVKLNSLIVSLFCSSVISRSLLLPARPAIAIPARQTKTPRRMTCPDVVPRTFDANSPWNIGGMSVPNAAQYPSATPMPSDIPR